MIVNIDAKSIEWVVVNWFAQDPVGMDELAKEVDQHTLNQEFFGLPERRIAKIFVFRLIYGGSAWSYCFDPDFNWISKNSVYWQNVIDKFYSKYKNIKTLHDRWVDEVVRTGILVMPTGRTYEFRRYPDKRTGELKWPRTQIVNYPVQGLASDLVAITRVSLFKRLTAMYGTGLKFISTVHDSIVLDVDETLANVGEVVRVVHEVFNDVPRNFNKLFGLPFNMSLRAEVSVGPNCGQLTEWSKYVTI